jgi:DNA-binding GntR family transcriptional regulator
MLDLTDFSLRRKSTAEAVADVLMRLIVSGDLPAGEQLREANLTERLGVSRNSLREAIRLLEQSRLVKYEIHHGAVVSTPTVEELEDLYKTRLHLELAGVRQEPTPEQLEAIHSAYELLKERSESHAPERIVEADLGLHQAFVDLLGSKRISASYRQVCKELVFYFTVLSYTDEEFVNPKESILSRHEGIYRAVCEGDRELAEALLREHIEQNFIRLKSILAARESDAAEA